MNLKPGIAQLLSAAEQQSLLTALRELGREPVEAKVRWPLTNLEKILTEPASRDLEQP